MLAWKRALNKDDDDDDDPVRFQFSSAPEMKKLVLAWKQCIPMFCWYKKGTLALNG